MRLGAVMTGCTLVEDRKSPLDFSLVFAASRSELGRVFRRVAGALEDNGMIWACWPKKSSGVSTDLGEHEVREIGLRAGLVDVKVCAVTDVWSGLKFVRRLRDRDSPRSSKPP